MSRLPRVALLLLLTFGFVRLAAAQVDEVAVLRAKAERGNALAQYNLGRIYVQGRLVPADLAEAFAWLTLASESGATGKALGSLLGTISDAQLTEGRRRLGVYRTALAARSSAAAAHGTPRLAPRAFVIEAAPPPAPAPAPATTIRVPEAVVAPITTSPAEGNNLTELSQARKDLEKARADLQAANAELAALRADVARLEAAAADAKAAEARIGAELAAAQQQLSASKPITSLAPAEKPSADDPTPPHS